VTNAILPWRSGRSFQPLRYGAGHSQLLLRSPGRTEALTILFETVDFVKLRMRYYEDLILRRGEEGWFAEAGPSLSPQLHIVLEGRSHTGLVSCSRVTVRTLESSDLTSMYEGAVLFSVRGSR
jgi:hypothetical protein